MSEHFENPSELILYSFGFKHGAPVDATMVYDVRFLRNPYWQQDLRPMSGCDQPVADYVIESEPAAKFLSLVKPLLHFLVSVADDNQQKRPLRIAIGCTGGRHRSVAIVEELKRYLGQQRVKLTVFHRDLGRER